MCNYCGNPKELLCFLCTFLIHRGHADIKQPSNAVTHNMPHNYGSGPFKLWKVVKVLAVCCCDSLCLVVRGYFSKLVYLCSLFVLFVYLPVCAPVSQGLSVCLFICQLMRELAGQRVCQCVYMCLALLYFHP